MDEHPNSGGPRKFVTRIAWLLISLSILVTIVAIAQCVAFLHTLATIASIHQGSPLVGLTTTTLLALLARVALAGTFLVVSIGLLKRWRWARRAFLALATVGLASNAFGLVVALSSSSSMPLPEDAAAPEVWIVRISIVLGIAYHIAACLFLGWLMGKFMSRSLRQEFGPGTRDSS
ncbi:MAG TPA: hypothetical protein VIM14_19665 [Polyangia bacterium]